MPDLLERLKSALADRYAVGSEIGRGGMAVVFLAEDLKHHRQVAIKVLHPELASSGGGERFLREIEIAARLKHPHILSLIDSGEAGGLFYFVMPYVEGESLRDRLEREKQLPIEDAIEIAREVADGLGHAHRQGVVHRDIKPANIMLSEGHALIADFGVARALEEEGQGLTRTGMAVGTPQYMSPEQATGTEDVDGRTDLYALGCVLFEMLAGAPPLTGPTPQATAGLRLTETATALPVLRDTVPGGLDRVTQKLLAKTPADRYPTAEKLAKALTSPEVWSSAKRQRSVGRRLIDAVIAVVLLAAGAYATTWFAGRGPGEIEPIDGSTLDWELMVVAPFQVTGLVPGTSTTIPSYARALFNEWATVGVADPVEAERLWGEAGGRPDRNLSRREAVELGRRFKAGATVMGEVQEVSDGVVLSAAIFFNHDGREVGSVQVAGSPDSLRELTQRAMISLWAQRRQMDKDQGEVLALHDPKAIGLYFDAHRMGMGEWEEARGLLDEALRIDSTFAMAALLRYQLGEQESETDRIAWDLRNQMTRKDQAVAEAFLTPRFDPPATAERQRELWRTAWELDPNNGATTYEYAEEIVKWNGLVPQWVLGYGRGQSWKAMLREVLHRSCQECGLGYLELDALETAARFGDAEWIRGYYERNSHWTEAEEGDNWIARPAYGRWLLAIAEADSMGLAEAADDIIEQSRGYTFDDGSWLIPEGALLQMSVLTGQSLAAADRIADRHTRMEAQAALDAIRFKRERGRHGEYRSLRDSLVAVLRANESNASHARDQVFEWAYYGEPETGETLAALDAVLAEEARNAEWDIDRASALCWQAQLRLHRGGVAGVPAAIRRLEEDPAYAPLAVSRMCAPFLRLLVALTEETDVTADIRALDSVVAEIPLDEWDMSLHRADGQMELLLAANLVIGRTRREAGHPGEALAVLQRRPDIVGEAVVTGVRTNAFGFTADYLREEAPLFAALGDTATAMATYEHYLRLRDERPDFEPWAAQWDSVRTEYEALAAAP